MASILIAICLFEILSSLLPMATSLPLSGIRVHLAGSLPPGDDGGPESLTAQFVRQFASAVLWKGGTLVHGSHPSFIAPLRAAAQDFIAERGPEARQALTLVRAQRYATPDWEWQIEEHRTFAAVEIISNKPGTGPGEMDQLVEMRDWMAERCEVVVALGGNKQETDEETSGVLVELQAALKRGRAGFVLGGFGGNARDIAEEHLHLMRRLHNGLNLQANQALAASTNVEQLVLQIIEQIELLPLLPPSVTRKHPRPTNGRMFRILALDGGGLRGTFTAAVLAKWACMMGGNGGRDLVKHFDLVAGTSTGSLLAIGIGLGLTPCQMLEFYRDKGPEIFKRQGWRALVRQLFRSKHDAGVLEAMLKGAFTGNPKLSDPQAGSRCRLVIPTVEAWRGRAQVITTAHSLRRSEHKDTRAVEAGLASAAAPTYFDPAVIKSPVANQQYLDGGVWANNPVLAAVAEAVMYLGIPLERIDVLSVGTLAAEANFREMLGQGVKRWASPLRGLPLVELTFAAQESGAATMAEQLLTDSRHLRVNEVVPKAITLDDASLATFQDMAERGKAMAATTFKDVQSRFLDGFHVPDWRSLPLPP